MQASHKSLIHQNKKKHKTLPLYANSAAKTADDEKDVYIIFATISLQNVEI